MKSQQLQKQQKDNRDEMKDFKWSGDDADEESRKAHAKLQMSNVKLGIKIAKLRMKQSDLYNKSWTATEKEDDKQKWLKAYNKAQSDYVKDNCKK